MSIFDVPVTLGGLLVFVFVWSLVHDIIDYFVDRRRR